MRTLPRGARALSLSIVAVLAALTPVAAAGPQATPRAIALGRGLTVAAPPAGYGIAADAVLSSGGHREVVLETGMDGITRDVTAEAREVASPASGLATIARSPSACSDKAYVLLSMKWKTSWNWSFNATSTPSEITKAKAERALKGAVASITGERNDCGRPDRVDATATYEGRTAARPGVTSDGGCRKHMDGRSVVGFGDLPRGVLALTCTVFQMVPGVDNSIESDVMFNKDYFSWTTSLRGCQTRAMLRSVATHEFGHVFGLGHVPERNHANETMSEAIGPCDDSAFTLGKGDMLGLEQRY